MHTSRGDDCMIEYKTENLVLPFGAVAGVAMRPPSIATARSAANSGAETAPTRLVLAVVLRLVLHQPRRSAPLPPHRRRSRQLPTGRSRLGSSLLV